MGSLKEERDGSFRDEQERVPKKRIVYLWSLMVLVMGGLTLGWWEYEYHPTNSQLWMVPFGLILLVTPLFVWFSIFVSDACSLSEVDNIPMVSQAVRPVPDDSV
ncbi:hypothetical protein I3843_01G076600 [Carya illinoinensis]|nr:hypothetical protein I3843_01G076600 [Carya illinoinensis]